LNGELLSRLRNYKPKSTGNIKYMLIKSPETLADKSYVFARVGVKTVGIQKLAYSATVKIILK